MPKFDGFFQPLLDAMHSLGGSANISEIQDEVAKNMNLTDDEINKIHSGNRTELDYRLAWARSYLKDYGLLENSDRGVWRLTTRGYSTKEIDKETVKRIARKNARERRSIEDATDEGMTPDDITSTWEEELNNKLLNMSPQSFEKLCQRLLRESGFTQVVVTGRSGDGGIDGKGILVINGILSFQIIFQCKRYRNPISSKEIRDFRGAMQGRADKGLFITTSTFTRDAKIEANRDGAPAIDLIDGNSLSIKMKELNLGVITKLEEKVSIDDSFFSSYD